MKKRKTYSLESLPLDEVLDHLANGDVKALDLIYRRYYPRLIAYSLQLSGGNRQEDVKDVIQEFFIWLAQNYDKVEKIRDFEAYLFRSVRRNIFLKLGIYRDDKVLMDRFLSTTDDKEKLQPSAEDVFIRAETKTARQTLIANELHKLPPHQWEVLYLRFYEGRSYKDIAKILSISDQVARNFASRGIKRLKAQLQDLSILDFILLMFIESTYLGMFMA